MYQHPLLISFNQESIERLKQQSYEIQLEKGQPLFFKEMRQRLFIILNQEF